MCFKYDDGYPYKKDAITIYVEPVKEWSTDYLCELENELVEKLKQIDNVCIYEMICFSEEWIKNKNETHLVQKKTAQLQEQQDDIPMTLDLIQEEDIINRTEIVTKDFDTKETPVTKIKFTEWIIKFKEQRKSQNDRLSLIRFNDNHPLTGRELFTRKIVDENYCPEE